MYETQEPSKTTFGAWCIAIRGLFAITDPIKSASISTQLSTSRSSHFYKYWCSWKDRFLGIWPSKKDRTEPSMLRPRRLVMAGVLTLATVLTVGQVSCYSSANCDCNGYNQQVVEKVVGANAVVHYGGSPLGSGIAYRKNGKLYVLTAAHVIEDEQEVKSKYWFCPQNFVEIDDTPSLQVCPENKPSQDKTWGTKKIEVTLFAGEYESPISTETCKLVFNDPEYDLSILEVEQEKPLTPLVKGCLFDYNIPRMGVPVYMMGNPAADYMTITRGIIGNNHRSRGSLSDHLPFFYQTDADGAPGSSGGGLYRADTGACVGVVVMLNCGNFQVYCVPAMFLRETLIRHNQVDLLPPST